MNANSLKHTGLFIVFLLFSAFSRAEIKLPAIFGDHMVLQQQADAAIWGNAIPNKIVKISVSWDNKNYTTQSDGNGSWKLKIRTPSAGGPYVISISDGKTLKLSDVLIGEVWICSGQSNMEMPVRGYQNQPVTGSTGAIVTSENKSIRLFTVKKETSIEPLYDCTGGWLPCTPENVSNFSATAYFYGRMIQNVLNVPVGIICASWGGTRIEPWISESGLKKFDFVSLPDKKQKESITRQTPTVLFNAMIHPLAGYTIRGGLWYQGEDNRNEPDLYYKLLPGLVDDWRAKWGVGNFPFYYAQIAPYSYGGTNLNSAFFREVQLKASAVIPNSGMACLIDVGEKDIIHPSNKQVVGERLAYLALFKTYGEKGFEYSGPVLKEMTVEGSLVRLTFDHAEHGLTSFGKELVNFKIAGENKRFFPAKASISVNGITLFSSAVIKPVAVRYAFDDFVVGELYNTEGLPASSFRTDDWKE